MNSVPASNLSKAQIKGIVQSIVVGQSNEMVKELLRTNGIKIGSTKADFLENMYTAVDDNRLTFEILEEWLNEVEGWGNQHIYLYEPLLLSTEEIKARIENSEFANFLNASSAQEFPDALALTSITLEENLISFAWHLGNVTWNRVNGKDFERQEDGNTYQYRAFKRVSDRSVVRFEWQINQPYTTLFIQLPHDDTIHEDVINIVMNVLRTTNLIPRFLNKIVINDAVNRISNAPKTATATSKTMRAEGGYVELVSTLADGGIDQVAGVRDVNNAVNANDFASAEGRFKLDNEVHSSLTRPIKLDLFGLQSRIRIRVKCKRSDIYTIVNFIWVNNQTT